VRADPAVTAAIALVADELGIRKGAIVTRCRGTRPAVHARQLAEYLVAVVFDRSAGRIAPAFHRDRSTVEHDLGVIEDGRDDPEWDARISRLEAQLGAGQ